MSPSAFPRFDAFVAVAIDRITAGVLGLLGARLILEESR
jgi:hypothetical protein